MRRGSFVVRLIQTKALVFPCGIWLNYRYGNVNRKYVSVTEIVTLTSLLSYSHWAEVYCFKKNSLLPDFSKAFLLHCQSVNCSGFKHFWGELVCLSGWWAEGTGARIHVGMVPLWDLGWSSSPLPRRIMFTSTSAWIMLLTTVCSW